MNLWHSLKPGTKEELNVIIEIPKLSKVKYEIDKETGLLSVDRILYSPVHYPFNYGFVPQSYWEDDDPLDVMVVSEERILPLTQVSVRPVGLLEMIDDGDNDVKVLAVISDDPEMSHIKDINDLSPHLLKEISHFFSVYKELEGKKVEVGDWKGKDEAFSVIERSFELYKEKFLK